MIHACMDRLSDLLIPTLAPARGLWVGKSLFGGGAWGGGFVIPEAEREQLAVSSDRSRRDRSGS